MLPETCRDAYGHALLILAALVLTSPPALQQFCWLSRAKHMHMEARATRSSHGMEVNYLYYKETKELRRKRPHLRSTFILIEWPTFQVTTTNEEEGD
jgi:hypothetical protein